MYDIKPFVPKIYVEYPNKTVVYDTVKEYRSAQSNKTKNKKYTKGNPYYLCTVCNLAQNNLVDYSSTCMVERRVPDYELRKNTVFPRWSYYPYKTIITENLEGHNIVPVARLRNELGDPVEAVVLLTEKQKILNSAVFNFKQWLKSSNSPDLRGLLPAERNRIDAERNPSYGWQHKYRHAISNRPTNSYYKRIRTFNERKQYAASTVEEYSPKVRAKRNISSIPNDWDDYYPHYDKSWKNKKIKKQWMLNL